MSDITDFLFKGLAVIVGVVAVVLFLMGMGVGSCCRGKQAVPVMVQPQQ